MTVTDPTAWGEAAGFWDEMMGEDGDVFQQYLIRPSVFNQLGELDGMRLLDAGCGTGHLARAAAAKGADVVAVDASAKMIDLARAHDTTGITYAVKDLEKESIEGSFDVVVCNNVTQHVEAYDSFLGSLRGALVEDGQLIMVIRHPCFAPYSDELGWEVELEDGTVEMAGSGLSHLEGDFEGLGFVIDEYFDREKQYRIYNEVEIPVIPRTLEEHTVALAEAGFVMERILEPRPEGMKESSLRDLLERIPHFLVIVAQPS